MSVEYSSGIARGFKLSDIEVQVFPDEIKEDLQDYGYLIQLDSWSTKSDWILAFSNQCGPEAGEAMTIDDWKTEDYEEICNTFRRYFPDRADEKPHTYLYTMVY